ncbi:hypothetical protein L1887_57664 [Cichorium endivia]|nr:hypothetical protein L1887_57664 [Cichorium endivia]
MNAMGHDVPTFIGVDKKTVTEKIRKVRPEYMPMGTAGMADMGAMEMEIPENTVPMMTGWGPHGPNRNGRHVLRGEGSRRHLRGRLHRSRLVRKPARNPGLGMVRRVAGYTEKHRPQNADHTSTDETRLIAQTNNPIKIKEDTE